jgi:hypothetical protein
MPGSQGSISVHPEVPRNGSHSITIQPNKLAALLQTANPDLLSRVLLYDAPTVYDKLGLKWQFKEDLLRALADQPSLEDAVIIFERICLVDKLLVDENGTSTLQC